MGEFKFGIFDHVERATPSLADLYEGRMRMIADADAAGFYCYHVAEHHMTPLGMAPSPGILLASVAQRTRNIHMGPLVYLLPLYNPLRLISEIAMIDNLSGGRFELGVGRGVSPFELGFYRVPFYESRPMFEEALEVLIAGLRNERLTHHGHYYHVENAPMELRPLQQPNPPVWYGVITEASVRFAARRGMQAVGNNTNSALRGLMQLYREEYRNHLNDAGRLNQQISSPIAGAIRHIYVCENEREIDEVARPAYNVYYENIEKLWKDFGTITPHFTNDIDVARKINVTIAGTPNQVRDEVARFFEVTTCNYLVLSFAWGNLTEAQYRRSLDLFASKVMPEFTKGSATAAAAAAD